MVIDDPDTLHRYLSVLKDAGVRRAKLGDVEVEFDYEPLNAPTPVVEERVIEVPYTPKQAPAANAQAARHPGYSALFGENTPKFKPVGEG